ncbi:MAG: hypothetical protein MMC33_005059 [Icmadophila ericetorum]|nr:hypothetical protein [Icmadophila ericetorum]
MSDIRDVQRTALAKLEKPEDWPMFKQTALSELRTECCEQAINAEFIRPTKASVEQTMLEQGFSEKEIDKNIVLVSTRLRDEIKDYTKANSKAIGILTKLLGHEGMYILEGLNTPHQMWNALKNRYEESSPMNTGLILHELSHKKLSEYASPDKYCRAYQIGYDKVVATLKKDQSPLTAEGIEILLQCWIIENLNDAYAPLVAQIRKDWTESSTNLHNTMTAITQYKVPTDHLSSTKALVTQQQHYDSPSKKRKVNPAEFCDHPKCVQTRRNRHPKTSCCRNKGRPDARARKEF